MQTARAEVDRRTSLSQDSTPDPIYDPEEGQGGSKPPAPGKRIWLRGLVAGLLFVFVIAALAVLWRAERKKVAPSADRDQPSAGQGAPRGSLRLKGTTEAVESRAILAPVIAGQQVGTLTITRMATAGSRVRQGDLLVEFDRQAQIQDFTDQQEKAADLDDQVQEAQAKEAAARAKDETEIRVAEDSLSKAQLEIQKQEILSRIDAEKAREDLDQAQATLKQLKETFDLKRKAAQAGIRILEIQRDRARQTMLHAQANAALMLIRSPITGIVVLNTIWKQGNVGQVQEGDQVRPGVPFMQVVDPSVMEVQVAVNQEDALELKAGQRARVSLAAYPDLTFPGRLESIDPMGRSGDFSAQLRTFSATFSLAGSDPRLMPDLSAAVDVDVEGRDDGAKAPASVGR